MSELNNKVKRCFGDYAVDKRLAYELELAKLPRYVAEFLICVNLPLFSAFFLTFWLNSNCPVLNIYFNNVANVNIAKNLLLFLRKPQSYPRHCDLPAAKW